MFGTTTWATSKLQSQMKKEVKVHSIQCNQDELFVYGSQGIKHKTTLTSTIRT